MVKYDTKETVNILTAATVNYFVSVAVKLSSVTVNYFDLVAFRGNRTIKSLPR